ncbi:hypothetical protein ACFWY9_14200 [Amycolatopsis sp. NPDC059027]|uniref:hypothetical protein n=1 Tax=unclassified Amycolatopsis TaxID=2618356 RepID=UPI00366C26CD
MSWSIYYTARRDRPLDETEQGLVAMLVRRSRSDVIDNAGGEGGLTFYDSDRLTGTTVLEGATKLPRRRPNDLWVAIQYWSEVLSKLRLLLPDAEWTVKVDDHELPWDAQNARYDPTR